MNFVGIDPGLTAPAVCVLDEGGNVWDLRTVRTGKAAGQGRVALIRHRVVTTCVNTGPCLASFEDYAYSRNAKGQRAGIECVGVLKWELENEEVPWTQSIGPMTLKKYLTGSGAAKKPDMIAAVSDRGVQVIDDNQADAYGLALILHDTYKLVTRGERPEMLYQYEVCDGLSGWVQDQVKKGAI